MTQKSHLKAMINHMIEKNNSAAELELHQYLAAKIKETVAKAK